MKGLRLPSLVPQTSHFNGLKTLVSVIAKLGINKLAINTTCIPEIIHLYIAKMKKI